MFWCSCFKSVSLHLVRDSQTHPYVRLFGDDEHEVAVVKQALQQHIDLDATRTFKVLCDQCTFDSSAVHPEEVQRLRSLVINFLKERYRPCVSRVVKDEEVWNVLFKGLLEVRYIITASSSASHADVF